MRRPAGLLGRLVEPGSVPAIFDVDADRPGLEHGRHRSRDIGITGLDVGGYRQVERRDDPRDDRRGTFRAQAGAVRYAEGPGHAGAGGGDRLRSGAGDRHRRGDVPRVRQQQRLTWLVQLREGCCALCLFRRHDRHASQLYSGELAGSGQLSPERSRFYRPTTSSWSSSANSTIMLANWPAIRSR